MAKPAYTICSRSKAEDRETNALSLFEIVERVEIRALGKLNESTTSTDVPRSFEAIVLSVWQIEEDDRGTEFDAEFWLLPPSGDGIRTELPPFKMQQDRASFLHRIMVRLHGLPPLNQGGNWLMETRIRRSGSVGEWIKQSYPIIIDLAEGYLNAIKNG